jgi:hypothetical protein
MQKFEQVGINFKLAPSRDAEGEVREEEESVWDQMNIWVQSARTDHGSDSSLATRDM